MNGTEQAEYEKWLADPTPDNMGRVLAALDPVLVTEVQHYAGPKPLLRAKAKTLAVSAVRKYDPAKGAALRSWVVTSLKPLSRYSQRMRPVQVSELASRQSAELYSVGQRFETENGRQPSDDELADLVGMSKRRIQWIKSHVKPTLTESQLTQPNAEGEEGSLPAVSSPNVAGLAAEGVYDSLDAREKSIYDWKTGANGKPMLSNAEIAVRLGVTPAAVSQISERISARIRQVANGI